MAARGQWARFDWPDVLRLPGSHLGCRRPDCVAGHVRLELRNVVAKYPFERSHRFPVIQPNSGRETIRVRAATLALTHRNFGSIFSNRAWPTETRLGGHVRFEPRNVVARLVAQVSGNPSELWPGGLFALSCCVEQLWPSSTIYVAFDQADGAVDQSDAVPSEIRAHSRQECGRRGHLSAPPDKRTISTNEGLDIDWPCGPKKR